MDSIESLHNFMTQAPNRNGIICSVFRVYNIKYLDFVDVFGEPHNIDKYDNEASWLYEMYNGFKVEVRYDKNDYAIHQLEKLKLRSYPRVLFEKIDFLDVMTSHENAPIFISLLLSIFKGSHYKSFGVSDFRDVIKKVLNNEDS